MLASQRGYWRLEHGFAIAVVPRCRGDGGHSVLAHFISVPLVDTLALRIYLLSTTRYCTNASSVYARHLLEVDKATSVRHSPRRLRERNKLNQRVLQTIFLVSLCRVCSVHSSNLTLDNPFPDRPSQPFLHRRLPPLASTCTVSVSDILGGFFLPKA